MSIFGFLFKWLTLRSLTITGFPDGVDRPYADEINNVLQSKIGVSMKVPNVKVRWDM